MEHLHFHQENISFKIQVTWGVTLNQDAHKDVRHDRYLEMSGKKNISFCHSPIDIRTRGTWGYVEECARMCGSVCENRQKNNKNQKFLYSNKPILWSSCTLKKYNLYYKWVVEDRLRTHLLQSIVGLCSIRSEITVVRQAKACRRGW